MPLTETSFAPLFSGESPFPVGVPMTDDDRTRLLFGPYAAPPCRVGDRLVCERYGESVVAGRSGGPIPWPVCRAPGRPRLILCGDLARAVRCASDAAVRPAVQGGCPFRRLSDRPETAQRTQ